MIYWEKNKTEGMIEKKYFYDKKFKKPDSLKLAAGEDYIYKHFCIRICDLFLSIPNFTNKGFKI